MLFRSANAIAEIDVDIEIDEVADTPTLQMEQFEQLTKLIPAAPQPYIPVMFRMMVEASNLRNKDKLLKVAEQMEQPPADPMQEQVAQLQMAGAQAEVEKTQSETAKNMATAQATQAQVMTDAMQAGYGSGIAA